MERNEVSLHEVKVVFFVCSAGEWRTANEIAVATGVAARTVRAHVRRLVNLGIFDQAEVFPGHRYRFSSMAAQRNKSYIQRLNSAADALRIKPPNSVYWNNSDK